MPRIQFQIMVFRFQSKILITLPLPLHCCMLSLQLFYKTNGCKNSISPAALIVTKNSVHLTMREILLDLEANRQNWFLWQLCFLSKTIFPNSFGALWTFRSFTVMSSLASIIRSHKNSVSLLFRVRVITFNFFAEQLENREREETLFQVYCIIMNFFLGLSLASASINFFSKDSLFL